MIDSDTKTIVWPFDIVGLSLIFNLRKAKQFHIYKCCCLLGVHCPCLVLTRTHIGKLFWKATSTQYLYDQIVRDTLRFHQLCISAIAVIEQSLPDSLLSIFETIKSQS